MARNLRAELLEYVVSRAQNPEGLPSAREVTDQLGVSRPTVNRLLRALLDERRLEKVGVGPQTRYRPASAAHPRVQAPQSRDRWPDGNEVRALKAALAAPLGTRTPVTYDRSFVDSYQPGRSSLLPVSLAAELYRAGRAEGQQPAGTLARKVLEQLLIDLSWHSSRLEGNRKSLLDTRRLFELGRGDARDTDATMLLNHKEAIEFMVDAVPEQGLTVPVIRNLHALLTQGLLDDPESPGRIRRRIVAIEGSVYRPSNVPLLLEEMLEQIVSKAQRIMNPIEASFFLWVNIAYLQPFEDGNKRTSRLSANLPLLLYNCAPLSFLDVETSDYASAMLGVYERENVALAVDLFAATYRRSIDEYRVALSSLGAPDPLRVRYRAQLTSVVQRVVAHEPIKAVIDSLGLPQGDVAGFTRLAQGELTHLQSYNCARYRLAMPAVERWIAAGRPGLDSANPSPPTR